HTEVITPVLEQVDPNNITEPALPETTALNQEEQIVRTQTTAWWQPAVDWMIHGNPILRVAVAVLMVGVVLLL
ncbi:hypothetical protein VUS79_33385, partial [Pseudomonas aeruginosa]